MSRCVSEILVPNMEHYNHVLIVDGAPINDLNYVNNVSKEQGKLFFEQMQIDGVRDFDIPSDSDYNESVVFDSFIPQNIETSGEIQNYFDFIDNLNLE